ncbi:GAF domain-containing protein [Aeromicrobium sp. Leaf245]|uniref:GAF domain-containing protein n=1 Tax=Aeromicrobium sp. Leaf245 TaxID=1736306 RepID=UPI0007014B4B|nr:GAF domain-containing protein [Aeromicrobium sp. Leaf245]KQO39888.1 hypothetical protein ASF05_14720 [Aeromicrobium sp. Leaf245]
MAAGKVTRASYWLASRVAQIRGLVYWPLVLALVAGGVVSSMFAAREFEAGNWSGWDYALFAGATFNAIVLVGIQVLRDRGQAGTLREFRAKMRTDFGAALDACVDELGNMAKSRKGRQRNADYQGVVAMLLGAAIELTGPGEGRMRATFYEYREEGHDGEGLYAVKTVGREKSTYNFLAGSAIGDDALHMVREREYLFNPDVGATPPTGWSTGKAAKYVAFLSVSCAIHGQPAGMLSVDSTDSADIDEDDVAMLTLVGRLLGVAYTLRG